MFTSCQKKSFINKMFYYPKTTFGYYYVNTYIELNHSFVGNVCLVASKGYHNAGTGLSL